MFSLIYSATINGIEAHLVEVETYISSGMPIFSIVGLPDVAVKESRDRVAAALKNSGFDFPSKKITVNLAPADIKKEGGIFDLSIALGILAAIGKIRKENLQRFCAVGELSLDGKIRKVKGVLPISLSLQKNKIKDFIVPFPNRQEAAVTGKANVFPFKTLIEIVKFINGEVECEPYLYNEKELSALAEAEYDFADVKGQKNAKRASEIAAAGSHNIIMSGPPGSGKTMIAKRIPGILPPMTFDEAIETTKIWSAAGHVFSGGLIGRRTFRSLHHTASSVALAGGGTYPKPGEVSLAHNGVLFLDEFAEFRRDALEVLRQPLEDKKIIVSRAKNSFVFPASFMLVAAMNPCPCGNLGHREKECVCTPLQIRKYQNKISGPLMDRIDIHIEVPALKFSELSGLDDNSESSATIRERVIKAREIQNIRFTGSGVYANAQLQAKEVKKYCVLSDKAYEILKTAIEKLNFSARSYDKILKISRTIADLDGSSTIKSHHIAEAVRYRFFDRS
ncbi:MAG: YifB family Mg chelatase-like AAA ATPase [Endomicrobium sp.]|uniref:YifB family Mg chelatase-like AAA ATPase n=1 Tax=Candidatus Endomicrobiellum pyrsonymphae TaxID=1408203 RepID=UPI0035840D61|nr:YifB family Mg chelatase-like AAA ATPase [Endomicrobium sp.]